MAEFRLDRSRELWEKAKGSMAGGVGSIARSTAAGYVPHPIFLSRGEGAIVEDADGNSYIDYLLAFGPLILGHRPPRVMQAVKDALDGVGSMLGTPHELEYRAAEKVKAHVPSIELLRFSNSGTEAVLAAIRIARAYTGKDKIVKFEGQYHGWSDITHFSYAPPLAVAGTQVSPRPLPATNGIPQWMAQGLVVLPWNDPDAIERAFKRTGHEIAAVLTEPIMGNTGVIEPEPGYLQFLREITQRHEALLIFDEVITGFRVHIGGAQAYYNVSPDLTTLAKALGGGFPVAAVGGRRDIMQLVADNVVGHSGTYNSSPLAMAAVIAVLEELEQPGTYQRLFHMAERLGKGAQEIITHYGLPAITQGVGPMFQIWFTDRPIRSYRDAARYARHDLYQTFWRALTRRGIFFHPYQYETWFVSTAHTDALVDETLNRIDDAAKEMAR